MLRVLKRRDSSPQQPSLYYSLARNRETSTIKEWNTMKDTKLIQPEAATQIPEPPIARFLFADTRMAWFWLIVRLYVGYEWLTAGLDKLTGYSFTFDASFGQKVSSPWVFGAHDGAGITGFVKGAMALANGPHPAVQGWY